MTDKKDIPESLDRRRALARLGLTAAVVYATPSLMNLNPASAASDDGGDDSGDDSGDHDDSSSDDSSGGMPLPTGSNPS